MIANFSKQKNLQLIIIDKEDSLMDQMQEVLKHHKKVCLVIVNNLFSNILDELKNKKLSPGQFYFVDALGNNVPSKFKNSESITLNIPNILNSMGRAVSTKNCDVVAIDNISSLLSFHPKEEVEKMVNDMKVGDCDANKILFCQKNETLKEDEKDLLKDIKLFADNVDE
jgi:hypothetical protein